MPSITYKGSSRGHHERFRENLRLTQASCLDSKVSRPSVSVRSLTSRLVAAKDLRSSHLSVTHVAPLVAAMKSPGGVSVSILCTWSTALISHSPRDPCPSISWCYKYSNKPVRHAWSMLHVALETWLAVQVCCMAEDLCGVQGGVWVLTHLEYPLPGCLPCHLRALKGSVGHSFSERFL